MLRLLSIASFLVVGSLAVLPVACAASADRTDLRASATSAPPGDAGADASIAEADEVEIIRGVPDRSRDPAVVAISIGSDGLCTGTLISPRLVLTARHCVSRTVEMVDCPTHAVQILGDRSPRSLGVWLGDDIASAHQVAHAVELVTPGGVTLCDSDIAILVLDVPVKVVKPLPVRAHGVARGDRVRAVGFGKDSDRGGAGVKLVREHVRVLEVGAAEFAVGEATCQGDSGGPAIDEQTGEVAGVVSRGGPACDGPDVHNIYTRVDTFSWLVDEAFARVAGLERDGEGDGGAPASPPSKGTKTKPPSDMGGPCEHGEDCAAGLCLRESSGRAYCSRSCGTGDRCPTGYHCELVAAGKSACVRVQ